MWTEKLIGPPGTGKTSELIARVERELADGMDPARLGYYSFTRAAARVARKRVMAVFPDHPKASFSHFRTLHSEAFRQLGWSRDKVMAGKNLRDFCQRWGYEVSEANLAVGEGDLEEHDVKEAVLNTLGDYLLFFANWRANRMLESSAAYRGFWDIYEDSLPHGWQEGVVRQFEQRYRQYKAENDLLDFSDMMYRVLEEGLRPDLDVIIFDEAQDSSPLQYRVLDYWLHGAKRHYIAGDPDQCLYQWMGVDPGLFPSRCYDCLTPLTQSYRVPGAVHRLATRIICSTAYEPRPEPGWVKDRVPLHEVMQHFSGMEGTGFIIVRNLYLLADLIENLLEWGIPFENLRGPWPFQGKTAGKILSLRRLFRGEAIPLDDLRLALDKIPQRRYFQRGLKADIKRLAREQPERPVVLAEIRDRCLQAFLEDPIGALGLAPKVNAYFTRVIDRYGETILLERPRVTIGTIHCSPPDEPILLANGFRKPIGEISPEWDRLVSFDESTNKMILAGHGTRRGRRKKGLSFRKGVSLYEGNLIVMSTSVSKCRVTPYHRVRVRFGDVFYNKWVVYLMRRDNWWRIGMTKSALRPYTSGGIKGRLASEKADAAWILGLYNAEHEARIAEVELQGRYGLPGLTFESNSEQRVFTNQELCMIHQEINPNISSRIAVLMNDFGLYADWPLYSRNSEQKRQYMVGHWFETVAANVLDGVMEVPVWDKDVPPPEGVSPESRAVQITKDYYKGPVISLEVPPYGYYVSGNQVVHNSVKGMEADWVAISPEMSRKTWLYSQKLPEEEKRVWYVAATRAREGVFLVAPSGGYVWQWPGDSRSGIDLEF